MLVKSLLLIAATFVGLASAGGSSDDDDKCHQPILCKDKLKTKTENDGCIRCKCPTSLLIRC